MLPVGLVSFLCPVFIPLTLHFHKYIMFCAAGRPRDPGEDHASTTAFVVWQEHASSVGWERHGSPPRHFYLPLTKRIPNLVIPIWSKTLVTVKYCYPKREKFFEKEYRSSSWSKKQYCIIVSKMKRKEKSLYFPCPESLFNWVSYSE